MMGVCDHSDSHVSRAAISIRVLRFGAPSKHSPYLSRMPPDGTERPFTGKPWLVGGALPVDGAWLRGPLVAGNGVMKDPRVLFICVLRHVKYRPDEPVTKLITGGRAILYAG